MTVREALTFSAQLRLPKSMSRLEKTQRVEQVIKDVRLQKCADTIIGTPDQTLRGISGGERKRTSIGPHLHSTSFLDSISFSPSIALALIFIVTNICPSGPGMELISNPSLLFLDEPTSGLDAFTALEIVSLLQGLAERGHTIAGATL
eukprot:SAG31_NODE_2788_length_5089_cov_7.201002_4_plen_148_part_00